ncbi:MAG: DNA internalization-related competence protein ComEC/Rec2 [Proteobacteria bacterium]|nr:DNA internalization-related competence protein ComEC/Rec2 [Pseudomonadota bacterium]
MVLLIAAAALFGGSLAVLAREAAPQPWYWFALLLALMCALAWRWASGRWASGRSASWRVIIVFFTFGSLSSHHYISGYLGQRLGEEHAGLEYLIDGVIRGAVYKRDRSYGFEIEVTSWQVADKGISVAGSSSGSVAGGGRSGGASVAGGGGKASVAGGGGKASVAGGGGKASVAGGGRGSGGGRASVAGDGSRDGMAGSGRGGGAGVASGGGRASTAGGSGGSVVTGGDAGMPAWAPPRLRLSWYQQRITPEAGDRLRAVVRVKPPLTRHSGAGFDEESHALIRRHYGSGYVRKLIGYDRISTPDWSALVDRWRFDLSARIASIPGSAHARAIVNGLANGDRRAISNTLWQLLNRTGTSHLMAISGLHIGLFALCAWKVFMLLAAALPGPMRLPRHWPVTAATLAATGVYALLCGMSLPTQRALIMLAVYMLAQTFWQSRSPLRALAAAFIVVVVVQPVSIISAGLWLSFCAVGFLLLCTAVTGHLNMWLRWIHMQTGISAFLLPVCLLWFGQSALSANAANAIAIPLVCFAILPLVWLATATDAIWSTGGQWLFERAFQLCDILVVVLEEVTAMPFAHLMTEPPPVWTLGLGLLGLLVLFIVPVRGVRLASPLLCLPLIFNTGAPAPQQAQVQISVIDVGQGQAVAVRTRDHAMMYDTGPGYGSSGSAGERIIAPWLDRRGIRRLDRIVVSHLDNDHAGGLSDLINRIPADDIVSNDVAATRQRLRREADDGVATARQRLRQGVGEDVASKRKRLHRDGGGDVASKRKRPRRDEGGDVRLAEDDGVATARQRLHPGEFEDEQPPQLSCQRLRDWSWDGVDFKMLWPTPTTQARSRNNRSCVLLIRTAHLSALILGDIDAGIEAHLVKLYPDLRASVLVIAHHGSAYSTHPALLAHTGARLALVSAGYLNRWNMPAPAVLYRLKKAGVPWLTTAAQGTISVSLEGKSIRIATQTGQQRRYWHRPIRREPIPCSADFIYPQCTKLFQQEVGSLGS